MAKVTIISRPFERYRILFEADPTIRLCANCGFRLPFTAAADDTLCPQCEEFVADEAKRDEANRRLSMLADMERRAEDE